MAHRKVTISDVARDAGVSIATVSRVMQGKQSVSADLAGRVQFDFAARPLLPVDNPQLHAPPSRTPAYPTLRRA